MPESGDNKGYIQFSESDKQENLFEGMEYTLRFTYQDGSSFEKSALIQEELD